jgi:CheY-like chemotaxis protein
VAEGRCVLVVEDDAEIRDSLVEILVDAGYEARGAEHGADALTLLRAGLRPGLILLDLMMPVMDGISFCDIQRHEPALSSIPVVIISAYHGVEESARRLAVAGLLKKPFEYQELIGTVESICGEPSASSSA